jgi:hypothetical protein
MAGGSIVIDQLLIAVASQALAVLGACSRRTGVMVVE